MGITFDTLKKRLQGELDVIPASSLGDRINDALRDLYDSYEWGFLFAEGYIRTPALISGFAKVDEFEKVVIISGATKTLVDAIDLNHVPIEDRQFRITSPLQSDRGTVYNITAYDNSTGELTIDPPFMDVYKASAKIEIFKSLYTGPEIDIGTESSPNFVIDFKRFEWIISPQFNRRLNLDVTQEVINRYDPWRTTLSNPQCLIPKGINLAGEQLYEMYPAPRFEKIFRVKYLRNGLPLVRNSDQAPNLFSQELIIEKAKERCYKYIIANSDKLGVKNIGKFQTLITLLNSPNDMGSIPNLLLRAQKRDEELYPRAYIGDFSETPYYNFDYDRGLPIGETLVLDF